MYPRNLNNLSSSIADDLVILLASLRIATFRSGRQLLAAYSPAISGLAANLPYFGASSPRLASLPADLKQELPPQLLPLSLLRLLQLHLLHTKRLELLAINL